MSDRALFATAGATNSGLYPAAGLSEQMVVTGQFPPALSGRLLGKVPAGLVVTAAIAIVLALGFDLNSIASIGSAVALAVFALIAVGHLRVRGETGASIAVLILAILSTVVVLITFAVTTLVHEPATMVALGVILVLSIGLDLWWKRARSRRTDQVVAQS
jgi:hypothetical protein